MAKKDNEYNYRAERKQRLAKSAKRSKKSADPVKIATVVFRVICVVLALAIVGGVLYAYGVPQRLIPAVKVGDRTYSMADYSFYYTSIFQQYANMSSDTSTASALLGLNFDYTKDPTKQTTQDEDNNTITYDQLFRKSVIQMIESQNYYLNLAKAEGMTLSDEHLEEIESQMADLAKYAKDYKYDVNRYISRIYGNGVNQKRFRALLEDQFLVSQYLEEKTSNLEAGISMDDITAKYDEDPTAYQAVDLRLFGLQITTDEEETAEEAEENEAASEEQADETETEPAETEETAEAAQSEQEQLCREMADRVTDEDSFIELAKEYCAESDRELFEDSTATLAVGITKETVKSNIDEELADWLFSADRKVGDKTVWATDTYVYVIMIKETAYRNETPLRNARHILISYDATEDEQVAEEVETTEPIEETEPEETAEAAEETTAAEEAEATTEPVEETEPASEENAAEETPTDQDGKLVASDGKEIEAYGDYTAEQVLKAYEKALDILNGYKSTIEDTSKDPETEFAAYADEYSEDTASIGDEGSGGGLYENIKKGQMVREFEDWVYDETRQPGDVGIVQTRYGFHVMYFVSANEEAEWITTIRSAIATDLQTAEDDTVKEQTEGTAKTTAFTKIAGDQALSLVKKNYVTS